MKEDFKFSYPQMEKSHYNNNHNSWKLHLICFYSLDFKLLMDLKDEIDSHEHFFYYSRLAQLLSVEKGGNSCAFQLPSLVSLDVKRERRTLI